MFTFVRKMQNGNILKRALKVGRPDAQKPAIRAIGVDLHLLYALAGALLDCRWDQLPEEETSRLILEFDALEAIQRPGLTSGGRIVRIK